MAEEAEAPHVAELLKSLAHDTGELVHQEMQLAATEMAAKVRVAGRSAAEVAVGGALAHLGLLGVLVAIGAALSAVVPVWAASLIVGAMLFIVGVVMVWRGARALDRLSPLPENAIAALRSGAGWRKEPVQ